MSKRIVSLLVVFAMLMSLVSFTVSADSAASVEVGGIELSLNGKTIPTVSVGELGVKVNIKCVSGSATPYVVVMLCEGNEDTYIVRDFKSDETLTLTEGGEGVVNTTLTCTDATDKFVKVMVTEHKDSSRRLADDAFFPVGNEMQASKIEINGEELADFDGSVFEHEYIPAPGTALPLNVNVTNICSGVVSTVENIDAFPGQIKITNTYGDCEPVVYTINVTKPQPSVKIVSINPNVTTNTTGYVVDKEPAKIGSGVHTDKGRSIDNFNGSGLEGSVIVKTANNDGQINLSSATEFMKLAINAPAEIYVGEFHGTAGVTSKYMDWIFSAGYQKHTDADGNQYKLSMSGNRANLFLYKKEVSVVEGETHIETLNWLGSYGNDAMYVVFVKWLDTSLAVNSIKVNGIEIENFDSKADEYELMNLEAGDSITLDLWDEGSTYVVNAPENMLGEGSVVITNAKGDTRTIKLKFTKGPEVKIVGVHENSADKLAYTVANNAAVGSCIHGGTNNPRAIVNFNDSGLEGSTIITTAFADGDGSTFYPVVDFLTLEFNNSAELYIGSYLGNANPGDGYMDWLSDYTPCTDESGAAQKISISNNKTMTLFKKTINVVSGEKVTEILKSVGRYGNGMYSVFVKWIDTTHNVTSIKINGTEIEGFANDGDNYVFEALAPDAQITVELFDSTSSYVVNYPENMLGEGSIVITNEEGKTRTIKFTIVEDNSLDVTSIKIGGVEIADFAAANNEYTLENAVKDSIVVELADDDSSYVVNYPEGMVGEGSIVITDENGEIRTIKLNFVFKPEVKIVRVNDKSVDKTAYTVVENAAVGSVVYGGNGRTITSFNNSGLEGATIIKTAYDDGLSANGYTPFEEWIALQFNASAELYIGSIYDVETLTTNKYMGWLLGYATPYRDAEGNLHTLSTSSSTQPKLHLYKKNIDVVKGETVTESIKNIGQYGNGMYTIFVKWVDTTVAVNSIKIGGVEIADFERSANEYTFANITQDSITVDLYDSTSSYVVNYPENMIGEGSIVITNAKGDTRTIKFTAIVKPEVKIAYINPEVTTNAAGYAVEENIAIDTGVHTDKSRGITNFNGSGLEGATVIKTANNDGAVGASSATEFMKIELNASAEIYVGEFHGTAGTTKKYMDWIYSSGYEKHVDGSGNQYYLSMSGNRKKLHLYKKTVNVAPGQKVTETLNYVGAYATDAMYVVFVKWIDTTLAVNSIKIGGVEIADFERSANEYTFENITQDSITVELYDSTSSYVVNYPENMLGEGSIVITNADGKTRTIKFTVVAKAAVSNLAIRDDSLDKTAYTIVENIAVGQSVHVGENPRAISDFGGSGLEGSTIITTYFADGNSATHNKSASDGFITFDINASAEIYIGSYMGNSNGGDGYMDWLSGYEAHSDTSGAQYKITAGGKTQLLYKKEVTVESGATTTVSIPSIGKYGNGMYSVFVKWID